MVFARIKENAADRRTSYVTYRGFIKTSIVDYDPRHLQAIENEGQKPSLELFIQLVTMFNISVDEYIFPNKEVNKSSARRRLDAQLDNLDDKELSIVEATVNGLCKAKEETEERKTSVFLLPFFNRQEYRTHR